MGRGIRREEESFQMAPMIDMVFLLLVFFMTVSTMAKEARPEVALAISTESKVPVEVEPSPVLTLARGAGGIRYSWYNRVVSREALLVALEGAYKDGERKVRIRGAADCSWKEIFSVLKTVREVGYEDWILCGHEE